MNGALVEVSVEISEWCTVEVTLWRLVNGTLDEAHTGEL